MTDATALPPPLVPPDVDLRDFQGMWVDTDRLLRSDTWILGNGDEKAAAFTLWCEAWHQVPAGSLPSDDRVLKKLSQADQWPKSRAHALRGWVDCNDGRKYHPVVAEKALEAWIEKLGAAISGATGNAKRWQVEVDTSALRGQFKTAVEMLRQLNPASRTFKKKFVAVILSGSRPDSGGESGPQSGGDSGGDDPATSPPDRNRPDQTGPDQTGPDRNKGITVDPATPTPAPSAPAPPAEPPAAEEASTSKRGKRLSADWVLPRPWGDWALAEYPQWTAEKVRREGASFRDHWVAQSGRDAAKLDWLATWRNWCRNPLAHRDDPKPARNGKHADVDIDARNADLARRYGVDDKPSGYQEVLDA